MDATAKERFVRDRASASLGGVTGSVLWSMHAWARLLAQGLMRREVVQALSACELIEDYPATTRTLPDCLVLGLLAGNKAIHVVVAIDEAGDDILVVTVYRPEPARWSDDFKRRR